MTVLTWIMAHKVACAIILYVLTNAAKRIPPPSPGWKRTVWTVFESCMIMPWDQWLGLPKTIPSIPPETK